MFFPLAAYFLFFKLLAAALFITKLDAMSLKNPEKTEESLTLDSSQGPPIPRQSFQDRRKQLASLKQSQTARASGMAIAALATNGVAVVVTVAFTRILGKEDYGSLAALLGAFTILSVAGLSLQVAVARAVAHNDFGDDATLMSTLRSWTRTLTIAFFASFVLSILLREPTAHIIGTPEVPWAAAVVLPTSIIWLLLSLQRGVLQGLHALIPVGSSLVIEATSRFAFGGTIALLGGGVTGAFIGTPCSMAFSSLILGWSLQRRLIKSANHTQPHTTLRKLAVAGWAPIVGLLLLSGLQNIDIIIAKHVMSDANAGLYAVAIVAAKLVVWVAVGIALYLLPEASRRAVNKQDPRPVLIRALGVLGGIALPALVIFAVASTLLIKLAFGPEYLGGADVLLVLGLAMSGLAAANLAVQYMLALHRTAFLIPLTIVTLAEPPLLLVAGNNLEKFSEAVLVVQLAAAVATLGVGFMLKRPGADIAIEKEI